MEETRDRLLEKILEMEVCMFLRVPTREEPSCRAHMEDMKLHRRGQFSTWSDETLSSYLDDLEKALDHGENLMTVKYARMEGLMPPRTTSPRIRQITDQFAQWQREFMDSHPNIMRGARDLDDFTNYLRSELETYSDLTLELLWSDVERFIRTNRNMSTETYSYLATQAGYDSLEAMERRCASG